MYPVYTGPLANNNPQIGDITFIVGFVVTGALYYVFNMLTRSQRAPKAAMGTRA